MGYVDVWISIVAIVIAFVSLYRTRQVDKLRKSLYSVQAQLTKLQLQRASRARVTVSMDSVPGPGNTTWDRFIIRNDGDETASNVTFDAFTGDGGPANVLGAEETFPADSLPPGQALRVGVSIPFGTKLPFRCQWSWHDPDGTLQEYESKVTPG